MCSRQARCHTKEDSPLALDMSTAARFKGVNLRGEEIVAMRQGAAHEGKAPLLAS